LFGVVAIRFLHFLQFNCARYRNREEILGLGVTLAILPVNLNGTLYADGRARVNGLRAGATPLEIFSQDELRTRNPSAVLAAAACAQAAVPACGQAAVPACGQVVAKLISGATVVGILVRSSVTTAPTILVRDALHRCRQPALIRTLFRDA
jgi:hypothetical protein